jgi:shikimate kinase
MGSGKTTAGQLLAERLQYGFADLDALIEDREAMPVTEIFARKGEDYFREKEAEVLNDIFVRDRLVIACGGGTPCFFDNMQKMKSAGVTVYLKVSTDLLARRLSGGHVSRPLISGLQGDRLKSHIRKLLAGREGWYRQCDITYYADNFDLQELLELIPVPDDPANHGG